MGWEMTLYDEDGKEKACFGRSAALEQNFMRHGDNATPIVRHPVKSKKVHPRCEPLNEVNAVDAFHSYTMDIISTRKHPLYKKGANSGPIRVDMWGNPYFSDKPFNHPPPTATDLVGFNIQAARLAKMEEQFLQVVEASNNYPDGYWHF